MAVKAVFVGVNKHRDTGIPELSGARPDATALWALFTDTLPGLSARLMLDERATHAEASEAILGALANADREDVVVVTFAGHGSPDGNLVLFDTDPANLSGTALSMAAFAEAFKATKARAVLCILDCCFSGQVPARVLATAGRPRWIAARGATRRGHHGPHTIREAQRTRSVSLSQRRTRAVANSTGQPYRRTPPHRWRPQPTN